MTAYVLQYGTPGTFTPIKRAEKKTSAQERVQCRHVDCQRRFSKLSHLYRHERHFHGAPKRKAGRKPRQPSTYVNMPMPWMGASPGLNSVMPSPGFTNQDLHNVTPNPGFSHNRIPQLHNVKQDLNLVNPELQNPWPSFVNPDLINLYSGMHIMKPEAGADHSNTIHVKPETSIEHKGDPRSWETHNIADESHKEQTVSSEDAIIMEHHDDDIGENDDTLPGRDKATCALSSVSNQDMDLKQTEHVNNAN